MIRVVVYLSGKAECQLLETQLRQLLSRRSNEELDCRFYADPAAACAALLAERADAICWDVTDPAGLTYLAAVRTAGHEAFLLVMAAATTSPLVYLKPELAPDSLILRPSRPRNAAALRGKSSTGCWPPSTRGGLLRREKPRRAHPRTLPKNFVF